jgi:Delta7-sterol 5-desaturase
MGARAATQRASQPGFEGGHTMHPLLDAYIDGVLFDLGRYFMGAGLMALVVWLVMLTPWRRRKIQARFAKAADYRREIFSSLRTVLIFGGIGILIHFLNLAGVTQMHWQLSRGDMLMSAGSLVLMFLAHDTYFYWTHRAMHHPRLFKWMHLHHHKTVTPTPWAAYSFAVPEAIVQGAFVPLFLVFVPMYGGEVLLFVTLQILRNAWGHAGVELEPRGMPDHPILGLFTTTVHHDLHHSGKFGSNFGLWFSWWDKAMGTEHPDYRKVYDRVTSKPQTLAQALHIPAE